MERRAFLLALASLPALRTGSANADTASEADEAAFAAVRPGVKLVFPLDHGAHPVAAGRTATHPSQSSARDAYTAVHRAMARAPVITA